ncbi:efflux RND transporter permease subunit [Natranaerofaba carboxydovora]|uniref:efflux RND transporter permease subunit n=1 Tax=Natranaerofaba carboxydovora TaxID=2742683 RepID=UPI001F13EA46|nr:efflux RND transporter permease subunit [Natranaerofaba carboxydovora]UMZ74628.1 Swarming motility protein SwrC [Natranaerofaba carboxydovora]
MNLSKLGIKRPVTVMMVVLIILLLATISVTMIPIDLYPDMELPVLLVMVDYEGAGPGEVENMVTSPLEEGLSTVDNLSGISSTSSSGQSTIILEFDWGTDMDFASLDVREVVDMTIDQLPDDVGNPTVMQIDPDMLPIIQAGISGNMSHEELTDLAEGVVQSRLERLEGVASVDTMGGLEREIDLRVDPYKLSSYGLTYNDVSEVIQATNIDITGGDVVEGGFEYSVKVEGEFESPEEIEGLIVGQTESGPVRFSQIGYVEDELKEMEPITRMNGEPTVSIAIQTQSGANTVQVAQLARAEMEAMEEDLPGDISFNIAMDQSVFIEDAIDSMYITAVIGAILAVVILWLFLGSIRPTLVIGIAIPISIVSTFNLLYFMDYTMNMITLGGLTLGIGMVVDNSIVLLENIYRKREEGLTPVDGAIEGSQEISGAIIASTLTTVAAFLPAAYAEGIAGIIFEPLAWTVVFALVASLVVALGLIPLLSVKLLGRNISEIKSNMSYLPRKMDSFVSNTIERYTGILKWALTYRFRVIAIFLVIMVSSVFMVPLLGFEFLPSADVGELSVDVTYPVGTTMEETDERMKELEDTLIENIPEIDVLFSESGGSGDMIAGDGGGSRQGSLSIRLVSDRERDRDAFEIADEIRELLPEEPGVDKSVSIDDMADEGGGMGEDVTIEIRGDDLEVLEELTDDISTKAQRVEGVANTTSNFEDVTTEIALKLDNDKAFSYGLTTHEVGNTLSRVIDGETISFYREAGEEYDIRLEADFPYEFDVSALERMLIDTPTGEQIPVEEVANIEMVEAPRQIEREDQVRSGIVGVQIEGRDLGSVVDDIQEELSDYELPVGYTVEYGGAYSDMMDAFTGLFFALGLAVILVYMVMASQFESLLYPFIIMFTFPQTLIGVIAALLIGGRPLSIVAFIGVIMLAGIVVNNGIVMVDYINQLYHQQGVNRYDAIIQAGRIRLRPILMTTLTTILGMLPMAMPIGEGAEMRTPMASVTIGGLAVSTVITLVLIPVVYSLLDDLSLRIKEKIGGGESVE